MLSNVKATTNDWVDDDPRETQGKDQEVDENFEQLFTTRGKISSVADIDIPCEYHACVECCQYRKHQGESSEPREKCIGNSSISALFYTIDHKASLIALNLSLLSESLSFLF